MCDVGGMRYDKDAVYVTMPTSLQKEREDQETVQELLQSTGGITSQLNQSISIVQGRERRPVKFDEDEFSEENDDDEKEMSSEEMMNENSDDFDGEEIEEDDEDEMRMKEEIKEEEEDIKENDYVEEGLDIEEEKKVCSVFFNGCRNDGSRFQSASGCRDGSDGRGVPFGSLDALRPSRRELPEIHQYIIYFEIKLFLIPFDFKVRFAVWEIFWDGLAGAYDVQSLG
jgi:hypothetical protein